jgi:hypothetical protein
MRPGYWECGSERRILSCIWLALFCSPGRVHRDATVHVENNGSQILQKWGVDCGCHGLPCRQRHEAYRNISEGATPLHVSTVPCVEQNWRVSVLFPCYFNRGWGTRLLLRAFIDSHTRILQTIKVGIYRPFIQPGGVRAGAHSASREG